MQALILVGGQGTRLRPLTATVPKPVLTLVDRPFIAYMLEWLGSHGIDDIVFSLGFKADSVRDVLGDGTAYGVKLSYVEEPEPMGTGGAVKYAEEHLDERFVMLNGDVLTDIDLSAQIAQHERSGARATIALVPVDDPSAYGLVRLGKRDDVEAFLEKPKPEEIDTNLVNAGAYVLEREVFALLDDGPASIERDLFPRLVGAGSTASAPTPTGSTSGHRSATSRPPTTSSSAGSTRPARTRSATTAWRCRWTGSTKRVGRRAGPPGRRLQRRRGRTIGPRTVLGPGVTVDENAVVAEAVVLDRAVVEAGAEVRRAIVAPGARIGQGSRVDGGAVIGADAVVGAGNVISNDARVQPGETIEPRERTSSQ